MSALPSTPRRAGARTATAPSRVPPGPRHLRGPAGSASAPARPGGAAAPAERTARRLRAVPPAPARQVVPTWAYSLAACVVLVAGIIGIVALNALAAEASFQARELEADISAATLRHDDLVAEIAVLEAPERVRDVARTQLGLIEPEQPGFLTLDPADLVPEDPKPAVGLGSAAPQG
ncbi:hypothetical protein [Euzebya sp.]|uniref:hypothetical protein n=1 Tax=Euzebya sp. TaxID=1971409 RepID=UPI0035114739